MTAHQTIFIKDADIVDPRGNGRLKGSLLLREGKIARVLSPREEDALTADECPADALVIDAHGYLAFPGLIDAHVHFRDPGFTDKEDITTGAAAAAHGGFTSVIMMGNTNPPMDMPSRIEEALVKGASTGIHVYSCGNVTLGMRGQELTDFQALKQAGAVLLSDDGLPIRSAGLMEEACIRAAEADLVLSLHEENPDYIDQPGINCGAVAESMGLLGASRQAEISMVARDIEIARQTHARITVQHISAAESVELIRKAKGEGVAVYAEATPHHFTLTEEAVRKFGTNAKMNPPLREEADREAIRKGLQDGTIEMIATDHAPHTYEEKAGDFLKAPSGIIGLETALPLVCRELVRSGHLTWEQAVMRMTFAYDLYDIPGGTLRAGSPADVVLFAPEETRQIREADLCSKASNSPFLGEILPGVVKYTICKGRICYQDEGELL